ncbi:hypothetical protein [Salinimicrobium sp. HB62]|uniref:hypothetical protein n=1 Tax=Salinimicrobium sp. HB62 TaxID=3077781 RepID=UPI002D79FBDA|nr:hypothetical protein [Salinimicrobium sp. HB62]
MIYFNKILFSFILTVFLYGFSARAQEIPTELQKAYEGFDATIGIQNTDIFTGIEYIEKHRMVNEKHKFFGSDLYVPTTVFYEGQPYFKIPVRYNIFDDLLLVKLPSQRGETEFQLFPNRLDGFYLNSRKFINVYEADSDISGIYELLYEDPQLQVLKKYRVSQQKISRRELVHYEFKQKSSEYFFKYKNNYYELNRGNLLELFPEHKSEVREYYRDYRKQARVQQDGALVAMFQRLSNLSNAAAQ